MNAKNVTYFDSFGIEHIPKEIKKFIRNKNIIRNIYRIQAYDSVMCGYFCIGFIDFMLKGKSLLEYTNLFSPNKYKKNYKIILKYFRKNLNKLKCIVKKFAINIQNLKKLKYQILLKKTLNLSGVYSKCGHQYKKIFKEEQSIEILKIIV